jgi:hypothetical protein
VQQLQGEREAGRASEREAGTGTTLGGLVVLAERGDSDAEATTAAAAEKKPSASSSGRQVRGRITSPLFESAGHAPANSPRVVAARRPTPSSRRHGASSRHALGTLSVPLKGWASHC